MQNNLQDNIEIDDSEFSSERNYIELILAKLIPLIKLVILIPGKIMRFILQIGDFYYFIQILSITFEYLVILLVSAFSFHPIWNSIVVCLFSCLMGNLLAVPAWELFQLRWIRNKNPLQAIFNIFNLNYVLIQTHPNIFNIIDKVTNFILGIIFYVFMFTLADYMGSTGIKFDKMNSALLLFIPAIKFGCIYISYLIQMTREFFTKELPQQQPPDPNNNDQNNNDESISEDSNNIQPDAPNEAPLDNNANGSDSENPAPLQQPEEAPQENNRYKPNDLDPFIIATTFYKQLNKCGKPLIFFLIKSIVIIIQIVYLGKSGSKFKMNTGGFVFSLFVFLFISYFALLLNMPIWILNLFHRWDCNCIGATEGVNKEIRQNPRFNGFKYIGFICQILPPLLIITLFSKYYANGSKKDTYFYKIIDEVHWDGIPTDKFPQVPSTSTVKSAMCFSKIYGLNLIQISSIAAASYYNDSEKYLYFLQNSFFKDENYDIKLNFLLEEDDKPVLLQADLDSKKNDDKVTIFSIRGSRSPMDWWLDVEVFVSSAMLSVAKWIPFLQRQEGIASHYISNFMTLPLNLMHTATLTYQYTDQLIQKLNSKIEQCENENRKILFTGHSLGGGLSKIMASKYQYQSVAVSGPGITPIENLFLDEKKGYDKFYKSKLVDIIPDRDIVPRFEISGGTRFRVLCKKSVGECHNKFRTICQMGVSCNDEYHTGDFCSNLFSYDEYVEMKKLAHIYI